MRQQITQTVFQASALRIFAVQKSVAGVVGRYCAVRIKIINRTTVFFLAQTLQSSDELQHYIAVNFFGIVARAASFITNVLEITGSACSVKSADIARSDSAALAVCAKSLSKESVCSMSI